MPIHLVPVTQGITRGELGGRLETGWAHIGRQTIRTDNTVLDPPKPLPVEDVDL
jgi:hypothetical protein